MSRSRERAGGNREGWWDFSRLPLILPITGKGLFGGYSVNTLPRSMKHPSRTFTRATSPRLYTSWS